MAGFGHKKRKMKLKWRMIFTLVAGWLIPLLLLTYIMMFFVTDKMNNQIEKTIITSMDKAVDICELQLESAITASNNASYMPTVRDSYFQFVQDENEQGLYDSISLFLAQQYKYDKKMLCAMIYFYDYPEEIYYTYNNSNVLKSNYLSVRAFMENAMQTVNARLEEINTGVELMNIDGRFYMVRNMVDSNFTPFGAIVMEINQETMFEGLNSVWGATEYAVFLDGEPFVEHSKDTENEEDSELQSNIELSDSMTTYRGIYENYDEIYVYKAIKVGTHDICMVVKLDEQAIIDELAMIRSMMLLIIIFMFPLTFMIFGFFHSNISKPIGDLVAAAKEISQGNYGYQIETNCDSWEFDYLDTSVNAMSLELKHQFEQIYMEELALKDAEIMALQSQINPHFLNNTLEIINWEARMQGNTKTSSMIEALSIMLNATMNRKRQNLISLTEEMSYVDAYLLIIQQRFGKRLEIHKKIDPSVLRGEVPRLIIQPIIENAVEHGMNSKNQGMVSLEIYRTGDKIYIDVINQGELSKKDEERIRFLLGTDFTVADEKSTSLGIRNVNRRLKIIYGGECGLTVTNDGKGNTISRLIVKINTPIRETYEDGE